MSASDSSKTLGNGRLGFANVRDVDLFAETLGRFERGEISSDEWRAFRLVNGVYGQRQEGVTMLRLKFPAGIVNAPQLRFLADVARTHAQGRGHVTTRQNVQFHFVPMPEAEGILRRAAEVGITTREACGNSVRTITASPYAGVLAEEPFDVTPYADALTRHLLRGPYSSTLPRKFKIAFGGTEGGRDDVGAGFHDMGFLARTDASGARGFRLTLGGGLATLRRNGVLAFEFLPAEQIHAAADAAVRLFHRLGNRAQRHKARLKFVVDKLGHEGFLAAYREEYEKVRAEGVPPLELQPEPVVPPLPRHLPPTVTTTVPARFCSTAVQRQKQSGFVAVTLRLKLGDLSARQFDVLADLVERFAGERELRLTYEQNLVIRYVDELALPELYALLDAEGLANGGARTVLDVTSCPGAMSCKLAVTASRGLASALTDFLSEREDLQTLAPDLSVKASGCPNSCGQHHVAAIGWQGGVKNIEGRAAPHYHLYLGGGTDGVASHFGKLTAKIPARRAPAALEALIRLYAAARRPGESGDAFFRRIDPDAVKAALAPHVDGASPLEGDDFIDLGETTAFVVETTEGECAA